MRALVGTFCAAIMAIVGGTSAVALRVTAATDDSPFDGVWVGTLQSKSSTGTYEYPLLLNLEAGATDAVGVALLADDLFGNPTSFAYAELFAAVKGSKLSVTIPLPADAGGSSAEALVIDLRLRRGVLKGKVRGAGLKPGKVELRAPDATAPLQQVWMQDLGVASTAAPMALALSQSKGVSGIGVLGPEFGDIVDGDFDGATFTGRLRLPSGDRALVLSLDSGALQGTIDGGRLAPVTLFPGGVSRTPVITGLTPTDIGVGREVEIEIRGKNLAPGFLLRLDHPDASVTVPEIIDEKRAIARIALDASVPAGTLIEASVVGVDGVATVVEDRLRADAPPPVSFEADLLPVFAANCALAGCHVSPPPDPEYGSGMAPGDLILEVNSAYSNLVGRPSSERPELLRVAPGDPDNSYLIIKLRGSNGIIGDRMPFGGPYLSDELIATFVAWIREGAPRN